MYAWQYTVKYAKYSKYFKIILIFLYIFRGCFYIGRSEYDSPEVDQEIIINSAGKRLYRGRFYDVVITDCEDYDLFAALV